MTHTYAVLEISESAHREIREKLEEAGYEHVFHDDLIDMHGIALGAAEEPGENPVERIDELNRAGERIAAELRNAKSANELIRDEMNWKLRMVIREVERLMAGGPPGPRDGDGT